MSADSLRGAQALFEAGHYRSSVNRAYYAAYCAVTTVLVGKGVQFAHGWNNPSHDSIDGHLRSRGLQRHLHDGQRIDLRKSWLALLASRVDADYRPAATVGRKQAHDALRDAGIVIGYVS